MSLEDCNNFGEDGVLTDISGDLVDTQRAIVFLLEGMKVYNCMNRDTFFNTLEYYASAANYISIDRVPQWTEILFTEPYTALLVDKSIYAYKFSRVYYIYR